MLGLCLQPCKSKGLNWPFFDFSGGLLWLQRGILAMAWSGRKSALISIIASSQVNANLCSLQYALNEQLTFVPLILREPPSKHQNWHGATAKHSILSKYWFTIFTNKTIRSTIILYAANIDIDVTIIGIAQQCWFHAWLIIYSRKQFAVRRFLLKGKKQKKVIHSFAL